MALTNAKGQLQVLKTKEKECKLFIPKKNFLNNSKNNNDFYRKVSDELIRYPIIQRYLLYNHEYLTLENPSYNIKDSEIIILSSNETDLTNYLDNIHNILEKNKFVKSNKIHEIVNMKKK